MQYDKEQINQWISEWEQSGLTITKFCQEKPFDKSTFYTWRKMLTGPCVTKQISKFVSVQVSPSYIPQMCIHFPNGVRVDVHMMLSSDEIRTLAGC